MPLGPVSQRARRAVELAAELEQFDADARSGARPEQLTIFELLSRKPPVQAPGLGNPGGFGERVALEPGPASPPRGGVPEGTPQGGDRSPRAPSERHLGPVYDSSDEPPGRVAYGYRTHGRDRT